MRLESLADYRELIRRHYFVMGLVTLLVGALALAIGLRLPRTYRSSVTLEASSEERSPVSLLPTLVQSALGGSGNPTRLQALAARLSSASVVEQARHDFGDIEPTGSRLLPPVPTLIRAVQASADVGSELLHVSVSLRESEGGARNAAMFANQLAETFRQRVATEQVEDRESQAQMQLRIVLEKRAELEAALEDAQRELLQFVGSRGNPMLWSAGLEQSLARIEALSVERRQAREQVASSEIEGEAVGDALVSTPELSVSTKTESVHPVRRQLDLDIIGAQAEAARSAGAGAGTGSDELAGLDAKRSYLEAQRSIVPASEVVTSMGRNSRYDQLQSQRLLSTVRLRQSGARLAELDTAIREARASFREQSATVPVDQVRLETLQRRTESLARLYDELLLRQSQAELSMGEALAGATGSGRRVGGLAIVDPAVPELRPIRPRIGFTLAAGVVLAILSGIGAGLLVAWVEPLSRAEPESEQTP
ncbi:hypothetical protein FJZ36_15480 [Candidatus Poribacteria bacterium]|nr:hypothetical protein [Candidatus Poribacteria bacterium]